MHHIFSEVLDAIVKQRPELASWAADKKRENASGDRFAAHRWLALELDAANQRIACDKLGISFEDLRAYQRILQTI